MKRIFVSGNYIIVDRNGDITPYPMNRSEYNEYSDHLTLIKHPNINTSEFHFDSIGTWFDEAGTTAFTIESLKTFFRENTSFSSASGGSGAVVISQVANQFDDLTPGVNINDIAYVYNSQGTKWAPGPILGTYYPAGWYAWNGTSWVSDRNAIANQFEINQQAIDSKADQTDLDNEITDRENGDEGTVTIHNDVSDAGSGKIITPQERIDINASIDVHNDVDLTGVIPEDGWKLSYVSGQYIPIMHKIIRRRSLFINTDPNINNASVFNQPINFQRTGKYIFRVKFNHSYDNTTSDIISNLTLNGNNLSIITDGEIIRKEPKDSGGNDSDGRGTNQKEIFSQNYFVDITTIGIQNLELLIRPQDAGVEASIWEASVEIEEVFNVTEI